MSGLSRVRLDLERDALLVALGAVLERVREAQGLSVAEVARRAGLSKSAVIDSRLARRNPRLRTLVAQAEALGCRLVFAIERNPKQQGITPEAGG